MLRQCTTPSTKLTEQGEENMAVIIAGVFPSRDQAEAAIRELRDRGFDANDVGMVLRGGIARAAGAGQAPGANTLAWIPDHRTTSIEGAGNVLIAGTISDCAGRQTSNQDTVSLSDALTCMGIERDHAAWYEQQVRQGYNLVTVRTENRGTEAQAIMDQFGAIEVPSRQRTPSQTPHAPSNLAGTGPSVSPPTGVSGLSQVKEGYDVYTSDGHKIGTVQESSAQCVHVLCCSNLFVPPARVERVTNDSIILNVPEDQLANFDWSTCQPAHRAQYQPGGPGYGGVPPQEHEAGVNIPIESDNG